ncbi:MAG: 6-phosphofructokinase [Syntrophobacteraceae bacterium]|nr:6-phosphofructokinase [Syntrophobacteraceae bacterium]
MVKTLAVMTSGGDSPGMNAAVRAVVRRAIDCGLSVIGVYGGYEGLVAGGKSLRALKWDDVGGILAKGGTFLGTARSDRFRTAEGRRLAVKNMLQLGIEALVVIGGDGSLMGAHILSTEWSEHARALIEDQPDSGPGGVIPVLQVVGLPGSIDNDLFGTDMSIGADTSLNHITRAIDDLTATAASHQRTFVVETMGRHCGYLALAAGLAGGVTWVLIPEQELELRWHQKMVSAIDSAREMGRPHQMVVVAEGARHPDGLHISSADIKRILSERLNIDVRVTVLGHVQRGGSPTAFDRILATRLGVAAVDYLLAEPEKDHCHMLGLIKNRVVATPLLEVVEKSRAVAQEIENGNFATAQDLRGESFKNSLKLLKTLSRITPSQQRTDDGAVAILTGGADAPGMNTAISVAARCLLNQGVPVLGARDGFLGLIRNELIELEWEPLVGWMNHPGSEIGTARIDITDEDLARISATLEQHSIKGLIAIGGWGTYQKIERFVAERQRFSPFRIPMVLVPASIDNNLPGTEFCIGSDTALNNIVDALDKIRHTAGATRRAFIVEVMGRQSGFLALMGALASGAEKAYLPETGISLEDLIRDVETLKISFSSGKRMVIFLRNEQSSYHYTTDFIRRLMEEESKDEFEVRTAILGHVQRGGIPTAFDRIIASRMGAFAAFRLLDSLKQQIHDAQVLGLAGRGIESFSLSEAMQQMDVKIGRPKTEWFMELLEVANALAKCSPVCHTNTVQVQESGSGSH